jgi:hypothetical protein
VAPVMGATLYQLVAKPGEGFIANAARTCVGRTSRSGAGH